MSSSSYRKIIHTFESLPSSFADICLVCRVLVAFNCLSVSLSSFMSSCFSCRSLSYCWLAPLSSCCKVSTWQLKLLCSLFKIHIEYIQLKNMKIKKFTKRQAHFILVWNTQMRNTWVIKRNYFICVQCKCLIGLRIIKGTFMYKTENRIKSFVMLDPLWSQNNQPKAIKVSQSLGMHTTWVSCNDLKKSLGFREKLKEHLHFSEPTALHSYLLLTFYFTKQIIQNYLFYIPMSKKQFVTINLFL